MANLFLWAFEHESEVSGSEKDIPFYGYLVNRGIEVCSVSVMTFGGEIVTWRLGFNDISPVKVRKVFEMSNGWNLHVLWNHFEQKDKPVDPPIVKDKYGKVISDYKNHIYAITTKL